MLKQTLCLFLFWNLVSNTVLRLIKSFFCLRHINLRCEVSLPVWWGTAMGTLWGTAAWPAPCAVPLLETGWGDWWELGAVEVSCWTDEGTSWWTDCWGMTAAGSCWGKLEWTGCSKRRTNLLGQWTQHDNHWVQRHKENMRWLYGCTWVSSALSSLRHKTIVFIVWVGRERRMGSGGGEREIRGKKRADCDEPKGSKFLGGFGDQPIWTVWAIWAQQPAQRRRSERGSSGQDQISPQSSEWGRQTHKHPSWCMISWKTNTHQPSHFTASKAGNKFQLVKTNNALTTPHSPVLIWESF